MKIFELAALKKNENFEKMLFWRPSTKRNKYRRKY